MMRAASAVSSTAENCGRPTAVIMRVVHIAPGPTPTFRMSAPARHEVVHALGGDDVAGGDRDAEAELGDGAQGAQHPLLVPVRGVDDEHVDARRGERAAPSRRRRR